MSVEMFNALLNQRNESRTLYFKNRNLQCEKNDFYIFRFMYYCILHRPTQGLSPKYHGNLDIRKPKDFRLYFTMQWLDYMEYFSTNELSEFEIANLSKEVFDDLLSYEEIEKIFYRMPWFIDILAIACHSSPDIRGFIQEIVEECVIVTEFGSSETSYFEVSEFDQFAAEVLRDMFEDGLSFSDLHVNYFKKFHLFCLSEQQNTSLKENILLESSISILKKNKGTNNNSLRAYLFFKISLWQVESDSVDSSWFVKLGVFEHLKKYVKNLLW